jgi:acyl-CoA reductase-like NAD-dependent aldehyde dehydrogenase
MQSCAPRLAQNMLELGGKSPIVVFEDVNIQAAVDTVMTGFLTNGGQICTAYGARFPAEVYTRGCHRFPRLLA